MKIIHNIFTYSIEFGQTYFFKASAINHINIYVINSTRLKEVGLSKLNRIRKYVMDDLHSIDIDSMFDWYMAEKVISSHLIEN